MVQNYGKWDLRCPWWTRVKDGWKSNCIILDRTHDHVKLCCSCYKQNKKYIVYILLLLSQGRTWQWGFGMGLWVEMHHHLMKYLGLVLSDFWSIWVSYRSMYRVVFGWPAALGGKNFNIGHCAQSVQPRFFTNHAYRHHWLLPVYTTVMDLDLAWGSQGQLEAKPIGFIFSHFSI